MSKVDRAEAIVGRHRIPARAATPIILKGLGRTKYEPITLERGVTHDKEFSDWANAAQKLDKGAPVRRWQASARTIRIELLNEAGQPVHGYIVHRCWVSEYQALPDLDAGGNAVAHRAHQLENEGWERDPSVAEPTNRRRDAVVRLPVSGVDVAAAAADRGRRTRVARSGSSPTSRWRVDTARPRGQPDRRHRPRTGRRSPSTDVDVLLLRLRQTVLGDAVRAEVRCAATAVGALVDIVVLHRCVPRVITGRAAPTVSWPLGTAVGPPRTASTSSSACRSSTTFAPWPPPRTGRRRSCSLHPPGRASRRDLDVGSKRRWRSMAPNLGVRATRRLSGVRARRFRRASIPCSSTLARATRPGKLLYEDVCAIARNSRTGPRPRTSPCLPPGGRGTPSWPIPRSPTPR